MKPEEALHLFQMRHSCRKFSDEDIDLKELNIIAEAGLSAPCARGIHASHLFIYKKGEDGYNSLIEIIKKETGKDAFYNAPVIVLVALDEKSSEPIRDGSAVIENMLLAASILSIGSCWIHAPSVVFSGEKKHLLKEIDIPENYQIVDAVSLGYPA
jgi:nitroreductase